MSDLPKKDGVRYCDKCANQMIDGFVIADGFEYYCSDECLHSKYSEEEYNEMYENDEAYWTDWYGEN